MLLEKVQTTQINTAFHQMVSLADLLTLLNEVKSLLYGTDSKPFELRQLTYHSNPKLAKNTYTSFTVRKKSGSDRTIHAPNNGLKAIQRCLAFALQCVYQPHSAAMGFVRDRSIVDNAKLHVGSRYVYNIDLKDFFPSIDQPRVWKCLQLMPFNLQGDRLGLANRIAALCCTEMNVERMNDAEEWKILNKRVLPQGAPTSPVLTNVVCQRLDFLLTGVAKRFGLRYSRYADDMTFSSLHNVYQPGSEFLNELHRIIAEQGFHIKHCKTRLQKDGYRKEVTGLLVNDQVNVQLRYIKQLRQWLYFWERYGKDLGYNYFLKQYLRDKGHCKNGKPDMENVIAGKLDFLRMVKGSDNKLYRKLKSRFDTMTTTAIVEENTSNTAQVLTSSSAELISPEVVNTEANQSYPIRHDPSKTVELLKFFTANDRDLKFATHGWEVGKYESYEDYILKIQHEWIEIRSKLKAQSDRLHAKISNYLFNDKLGKKNEKGYHISWGEMKLKFGWSSPELKIHMNEPGNAPFSCPIPDHIRELDKRHNLYYFKDYADIFKNEIEFREDSNNFKKMILDLWENELGYDFNIKGVEQLVGFSFFTDVHLIKGALQIVFRDMFKGKPEFPEVIIEKTSNFENGGYHSIKITQKGSFIKRAVDDIKLTSPSGNLHSIIKTLKNLADYSIVSKFGDGRNYRINYLASSKTTFVDTLPENENVLGFTHEFKFYLL